MTERFQCRMRERRLPWEERVKLILRRQFLRTTGMRAIPGGAVQLKDLDAVQAVFLRVTTRAYRHGLIEVPE